jgi:hypothetical protein
MCAPILRLEEWKCHLQRRLNNQFVMFLEIQAIACSEGRIANDR